MDDQRASTARAESPQPYTARGPERRTLGPEHDDAPEVATVRAEDLEPHAGLRYIARLFKVLAILLILLLIGEIIINLSRQGLNAVPLLLVEATRLIVFAGLLWGTADMALMLIESNHDLRATRILVGRMNGKLQKLVEMEADELEVLAANPNLMKRDRTEPPQR